MKRQLAKGLFVFSLLMVLLTILEPGPNSMMGTSTTENTVISSSRAPGDYTYDYPMRNSNFTNQNMSVPSPYAPQYWKYQEPAGDSYSILTGGWDTSVHGQGTSYIRLNYGTTSRSSYGEWYQEFSYDATANANLTANLSVRWRCDTFTNAGTNNTMSVWLKHPNGTTFRLDYWSVTGTSNWALRPYNVTDKVKNGNGVFRVTLRYYGTTRSGYTTNVRVWWDDCAIAFKYNPLYPPSGLGLVLNGAANFTNAIQVSARLLGFGISEYCLSNNHTQGSWTSFSSPVVSWNLNGTEGNVSVFFWARNIKGTVGPVDGTIILDTTPPNPPPAPLIPLNSTFTRERFPTFSWANNTDPLSHGVRSGIDYYLLILNSSSSSTQIPVYGTSYLYDSGLFDDVWRWSVLAVDKAGNLGNPSLACIMVVDNGNPNSPDLISPFVSVGTVYLSTLTPTFDWGATSDSLSGIANYTLQYAVDAGFTQNVHSASATVGTSYTAMIPLFDGTWYWHVLATDRAGNSAWSSKVGVFTIDTVSPNVPVVTSPQPGSTWGYNPTLKWTTPADNGSGIHYYIIQIDTSLAFNSPLQYNWSTNEFVRTESLSEGTWYWRVAAVDKAGNIGNYSDPVSFVVAKPLDPMMVAIAGGGSGAAVFLLILGYYFVRRSRIPFVIKKLDQSMKLISRGEMPQAVPMRTRSQILASIYQDKLSILSKERLEEPGKKQKKSTKKPETTLEMKSSETLAKKPEESTKERAPEVEAKTIEAPSSVESEEADVALIAKELEKLETKGEAEPTRETDFIKREIEELEKEAKKKKKKGN